jgi:hypothetical protein
MNAIDDSTHRRHPGGYRWVPYLGAPFAVPSSAGRDDPKRREPALVPVRPFEFEQYSPPADLFLKFAEIEETPEATKNFADQYGLLGLQNPEEGAVIAGVDIATAESNTSGVAGSHSRALKAFSLGEKFSAWQVHIAKLRNAVMLWSALCEAEQGKTAKLRQHIQWPSNSLVYFDSHPHLPAPSLARFMGLEPGHVASPKPDKLPDIGRREIAVIASQLTGPEWLKFFRSGDRILPARYYLQKTVNEALLNPISPRLLWNVKRGRPKNLGLYFVPTNLLGLIWLQFAEAIVGTRSFRQCSACKTWIVISRAKEGSRSSRFTCSTACRMRLYYRRQTEARRLRGKGISVTEIARRLSAKPEKVRRWITT